MPVFVHSDYLGGKKTALFVKTIVTFKIRSFSRENQPFALKLNQVKRCCFKHEYYDFELSNANILDQGF